MASVRDSLLDKERSGVIVRKQEGVLADSEMPQRSVAPVGVRDYWPGKVSFAEVIFDAYRLLVEAADVWRLFLRNLLASNIEFKNNDVCVALCSGQMVGMKKWGAIKKAKRSANLSEAVIRSGQLFYCIMRKVRAAVVPCGGYRYDWYRGLGF